MSVRIIIGDALEQLRLLPAESVHCCVTSPPYYGLRDYGMAGQIGLEPSPDEYIAALVAVFREVRRVLRSDGTLWLNIGDSYAGGGGFSAGAPTSATSKSGKYGGLGALKSGGIKPAGYVKPKDIIGIPWMLAFALRADGWYLRQDIIWSKPNPMPEGVTDRCTKAHEYLFLLSKSARYYFDAAAIAEKSLRFGDIPGGSVKIGSTPYPFGGKQNLDRAALVPVPETRNKRSVWTVATEPFVEAHFACFPPALIEPCILAGCPEKCCVKCGSPWMREVEKTRTFESGSGRAGNMPIGKNGASLQGGGETLDIRRGPVVQTKTLGFAPSCACGAATMLGTVLDPFGGAGTTGLVADRLGRNATLIELNPLYADMSERRIYRDGPLFADVAIDRMELTNAAK